MICAFDLAFHDLLSLAAGMPLYRLLGGYRDRIQTSITIPIAPEYDCVANGDWRARPPVSACSRSKAGSTRMRMSSACRRFTAPCPTTSCDWTRTAVTRVQEALDVARALENMIEMLEQPTPADDLPGLRQVKENSPVPILADQSLSSPASALELACHSGGGRDEHQTGVCGGLSHARQIDAIARAAKMATMIGCLIEPAMLISAGLSLALSSPNVHYADLDGQF